MATEINGGLRKLTMDAPFALRGILTCAGSGYCSMDGFRQPPSLEQLRGYKTVVQFPRVSSSHAQPSIYPRGSRGIHGSHTLSESAKGANRPLSPHLALKKPQLAATYSISHRIFGASVASLILLSPILMKYSVTFDV